MEEMEKIEKVQKLCEKTGATAEAANAALEACQWDMFEAFLKLDQEKQAGTVGQNINGQNNGQQYSEYQNNGQYTQQTSGSTGYAEYNTSGNTNYQQNQSQYQNPKSSSFGETVSKCLKWCADTIQRGMVNFLDLERDGRSSIHIPITIFVLLFIFFNVFVLVLMVVGLFCGFRYSFSGPDFDMKPNNTEGANYGDKDSNR